MLSAFKSDRDNPDYRKELRVILRGLYQEFESEYKSLDCRDITGIDFTNPEEVKMYREENRREQLCKPLVKYVVGQIYSLR